MERIQQQYQGDEQRPLRGYLTVLGVYSGLTGALAVAGRAMGKQLPDRIGLGDTVLLSVATHKASRLLSKDAVTSPLRAPFTHYEEPAGEGELNESVRGHGVRAEDHPAGRHRADRRGRLGHAPARLRRRQATAGEGLVMTPKVVVVTGASGGVGRATVREFARRGDKVALLARGQSGLDSAAEDIRSAGGEALVVPVDMADPEAVEQAADRVERELGPIDVWVNDAFTGVFAPVTEIEPAEFKRVTEVSYLGYVYGTKAALNRMTPRDSGVIVQVGSALAYRGIPLQSAYCAAKHAVQGFHEALRCELLHTKSGVRVTMVQLPAVNTPQFGWVLSRLPKRAQPVPPIYQPEVAARAIVYAAGHPRRRERWVGMSTVATLLGDKVMPGLLDHYLARTGYKSQQTGAARDPRQPANLWQPADQKSGTDQGAHGDFDDTAHPRSLQQWAAHHPALLAGGLALAAAGLGVAGMARRP
jgi:NAD(P)-dependent dehydrogenase (short-subunit alcohol dehydrogenase family)